MNIPVDIGSLESLEKVLTNIESERGAARKQPTAMVQELLTSTQGWTGVAAKAFSAQWDTVQAAEGQLQGQFNSFIAALGALIRRLESASDLADAANKAAAQKGFVLDEEGNVSLHGWDDVDPIRIYEKDHVENLAHEAVAAFTSAQKAAIASLDELHTISIGMPTATGSAQSGQQIMTHPDALCVVAVKGMTPLGNTSDAEAGTLLSEHYAPEVCLPLNADQLLSVIADSVTVLMSELRTFGTAYGELSTHLVSAAGAYLNNDQQLQSVVQRLTDGVLVTSGGIFNLTSSSAPSSALTGAALTNYKNWAVANDLDWTQCAAWASYRRVQMCLTESTGDGWRQASSVGVASSPNQVQPGSLISIASDALPGDPAGHVMVVETVRSSNPPTFVVSEMNVMGDNSGSGRDFRTNTVVTETAPNVWTITHDPTPPSLQTFSSSQLTFSTATPAS